MARQNEKGNRYLRPVEVVSLQGPIVVAYRRERGKWLCTALQFDIVGVGRTKEAAFCELHELLSDYLEEVLAAPGAVRLFNPSDAQEWNVRDQESYTITFVLSGAQPRLRFRPSLSNLGRFRAYHDAIQGIGLVPAGA